MTGVSLGIKSINNSFFKSSNNLI